MSTVTGDGCGGLEHRASTALMASRRDLPTLGQDEAGEGYQTFLGLVSHEYFHTWNVTRIKPAVFAPYDLSRENHTRLDRQSVVSGKSVSVRVDLGGRRILKTKQIQQHNHQL